MYVILDSLDRMDGVLIEDDAVNTLPDWTIVGKHDADYVVLDGELIKIPEWVAVELSSDDLAEYGLEVIEWESL